MNKPRTLLVGCGGISSSWLGSHSLKTKCHLVGLVDLDTKAAERQRDRHQLGDVVIDTNVEHALKTLEPEVVFDCTVPPAHYGITSKALRHGCHVFGEKPMCDTMVRARRIRDLAASTGCQYAIMQNRRYTKPIRSLQKFIQAGKIGELVAVHSDFFLGAHFGGFREKMEHVLLLDMAIHSFDQARFLTGLKPLDVYCREWTPRNSWFQHGPSASAIFGMENEVAYTYNGSWCAEGCSTTWECSWRIIGTKGTILWDGGPNFQCEVVAKPTADFFQPLRTVTVPLKAPDRLSNGHDSAIGAFLDALSKGETPETHAADNILSLAMVHGAIRSARTRRLVKLEGLL